MLDVIILTNKYIFPIKFAFLKHLFEEKILLKRFNKIIISFLHHLAKYFLSLSKITPIKNDDDY
jgi:hypothetical protein